MKIHKLNLENYYRNAIDSAIAKMNGLPEAIFAGRPTYNEAALKFSASETPVLALPQWAQFTVDLTQDKPSWAPASGSLKATFAASVSGVEAGDTMDLDSEKVYGASVTATAKQYTVGAGKYTVVIQANILNGDDEVVLSYTSQAMKVAMTKEADVGPDTTLDIVASGGSFTQEQADWSQSDDTAVDYIKNKPTIPAAQVNADWNAESGVAQILNKPTIPAAPVNADWNAESGLAQILNKPTIPTVNNATLTLTQGTTTLGTFTANASTDVTVDIPAGGGGGDLLVEKTWSELKAMRDGGTLVPGQQYRITDYVATTARSGTSSANKPFDIIVTADSASKLNEEARAILHSGDNYFANCKLEAWKLWYCLDNDTNRFAWADSTNGKGVVYRMIDEWSNDIPYDFKGIKFSSKFTFDKYSADKSLDGNCSGNKVGTCWQLTPTVKMLLRENLFGRGCVGNKFADGCYYNTIGDDCCRNTFGPDCYSNTLGVYCTDNVFGRENNNITLKDSCTKNHFGNVCSSIRLDSTCNGNRIGDDCSAIYIGSNSSYNTIGQDADYVSFGPTSSSLKSYYSNVVVEDGVKYISLICSGTTSSSAKYQNVKVCSGIAGTNNAQLLTISDSNVNQTYQTTFFNETDGTLKKQEGSTVNAYTPPA